MLLRRLTLFFLLLLLIVLVAGYAKFGELREFEQWDTNAQKSQTVLRQLFHELHLREKLALRQAAQTAGNPELVNALVREQDPRKAHDTVQELLKNQAALIKSDFIWITNAQAKVIARSEAPKQFDDSISELPLVAAALRGDAQSKFTVFSNQYSWVASSPIYDERGRLLGLALVGYTLNPDWLKTVANQEGANILLFSQEKVDSFTGSSDMGFGKLLGKPETKELFEGKLFTQRLPYKQSAVESAALLFGDELAPRKAGLAVLIENKLPNYFQPTIAPTDPFMHTWYAIVGVLLILSFIFTLATRWGIKHEAKKVAKKILDISMAVPGATLKAGSYMSEFEPLVKMLLGQLPTLNQTRPLKTLSETSANVLNELLQDNKGSSPGKTPLPGQNAGNKAPKSSASDSSIQPITSLGAAARRTPAEAQPQPAQQQSPMPGFMPGSSVLPPKDESSTIPPAPKPASSPAPQEAPVKKESSIPLPPRKQPSVSSASPSTPTPSSTQPPVSQLATPPSPPTPAPQAPPQAPQNAPIRMTMTMATIDPAEQVPDSEEAYLAKVFQDYVALRQKLGEAAPPNREKFIHSLRQNSQKLKEKFKCSRVRFTVFEKQGKASVKAAPVR